jgi:hypothetical protein
MYENKLKKTAKNTKAKYFSDFLKVIFIIFVSMGGYYYD